ncbi:MFS transporter [Bacillus sp. J33]|uniref:MFS transporter n=1 Tax=Bacillus sp. J33 TaxID=935836 RepID=UPI00047DF09B|nr:MFS transporter [Bacillus sp. J33]
MEALIKRNVTLFLAGKMSAVLGSSIYSFAIGLYILAETGSSLNFAITLILSTVPRILLSPVAGAFSDRWDRKKIIIISDFACAIWLIAVLLLFLFAAQDIWLLYTAAAVLSILNTFYSAAVTSAIYNMVGPDHLQKALSLNQTAVSLSAILGPVLGGVFFGIFHLTTFMLINIITFTVSGISSLLIHYNLFAEEKEETRKSSMIADLKMGVSYVKNQPFIKNLIIISIWLNFWFAIFPVAMPYLVLTIREMSSVQLGIIEGAFSVGTLAISIYLSARPEVKRKEFAIFEGIISMSIIIALLGLPNLPGLMGISNNVVFPFLIVMVLLLSATIILVNMPVMVLLQKGTPDMYRGRVMSLLETGASAMTPLGFIAFGFLLEKMPVWILMAFCGMSILTLILYHLRKRTLLQLLREADQPKKEVSAQI